jgi:DNA-binding MurR/RpiR family transcriptional regulator
MSLHGSRPSNAEELRAAILERYDSLSRRLQQIARYVLDEPHAVALETLAVLAGRMGVQPSAIVRFAKSFGFDGATGMQRLLRDDLLAGGPSLGYGERAGQFARDARKLEQGDPAQMLAEVVAGNVLALQNLASATRGAALGEAARMVATAQSVYVAGFRHSFPVAAYLAHALRELGRRVVFVDGLGGTAHEQARAMTPRDLLIVLSHRPYVDVAAQLVRAAVDAKCPVLSISDSLVSAVAKPATLALQAREAEFPGTGSLAASMCLAQSLLASCAFALGGDGGPAGTGTRNKP